LPRGEVLVAIINNPEDMRLAREAGWYRIPVLSARKWLRDRWPPRWLAFYQTKIFGPEAYAVNYYAVVRSIRTVSRTDLFPDTPRNHPKANRRYYQLLLEDLQPLAEPIVSHRVRRIVFIPTTFEKFKAAVEINDLWDESPLEDRLWAILKRVRIRAERQYPVEIEDHTYFLDFAIFCSKGNIDVETDGDTWHIGPESALVDRRRNNALASRGWRVLRFNTSEVRERPVEYCVSKVMSTINHLGGLDHTTGVPVRYDPDDPLGPQQLGLFDQKIQDGH
jgi:very-short-patch-repair endonuclease